MTSARKELKFLALVLVVAMLTIGAPNPRAWAQEDDETFRHTARTPYMMVIDTSGSMGDSVQLSDANSTSRTRLALAQEALLDVVGDLGETNPLGILSYPGAGATDGQGCSTGELLVDPGSTVDRSRAESAVQGLHASGDTPTGPALRNAADILRNSGASSGAILLFSDGEANCGSRSVCEVAEELSADGFDVQVNTVGLNLPESARAEMECVANVTGGRAMLSDDPNELKDMLRDSVLPTLDVQTDIPAVIPRSIGPGGSGSAGGVTVGVNGSGTARDVRAAMTLMSANGQPGAVTVTRPVQYYGNITVGETAQRSFTIKPSPAVRPGDYRWRLWVSADNAETIILEGDVRVTDELDPGAYGPIFDDVQHAVIMGDSYASGEGAAYSFNDYDADETGGAWCHRSGNAYGELLFGNGGTTNIACSGAVADDFVGNSRNYPHHVQPQLDRLDQIQDEEQVDAVLMSVGGNDTGFGGLIGSCVSGENCGYGGNGYIDVSRLGGAAQENIFRAIMNVHRTLNDEDRVEERDGRFAPIVVVPYPRIIPFRQNVAAPGTGPFCFDGVDAGEYGLLNAYLNALNGSVQAAVMEARSQGVPAHYPEPVIHVMQTENHICAEDNWAVRPRPVDMPGLVSMNETLWWRKILPNDETRHELQELAHPNARGHVAMAQAIAAWSTSAEAAPTSGNIAADSGWSRIAMNAITEKPKGWFVSGVGFVGKRLVINGLRTWNPRATLRATALDVVTAPTWRLNKPGAPYTMSMRSRPVILGTGELDENGNIAEDFVIPEGTPPGIHTIYIETWNQAGERVVHEQQIRVVSNGTILAIGAIGVGLIVLLTGALGWGSSRLRSAAAVKRMKKRVDADADPGA